LFERGETQASVARRLRVSRTTAMRWEQALKAQGREGLRAAGRAGRKPRLSEEQVHQVEQALLEGPGALGYATELWTLPRVAELIRKLTGVRYHRGHVWRVLHRLGWSRQRPTTRARERDEEAITHWVKVTWPGLKETPLAAAPRSSSSTRVASRSDPRSAGPGRRGGTPPS
jgi:transposase